MFHKLQKNIGAHGVWNWDFWTLISRRWAMEKLMSNAGTRWGTPETDRIKLQGGDRKNDWSFLDWSLFVEEMEELWTVKCLF